MDNPLVVVNINLDLLKWILLYQESDESRSSEDLEEGWKWKFLLLFNRTFILFNVSSLSLKQFENYIKYHLESKIDLI